MTQRTCVWLRRSSGDVSGGVTVGGRRFNGVQVLETDVWATHCALLQSACPIRVWNGIFAAGDRRPEDWVVGAPGLEPGTRWLNG